MNNSIKDCKIRNLLFQILCISSFYVSISSAKLTGMVAPKPPVDTERNDLHVEIANESRRSGGGSSSSHDEMISRFLTSTSYAIGLPVASVDLITDDDVLAMHTAWGNALVSISKTYEGQGYDAAKELAQSVLDSSYCYRLGIPVLFKPTLAYGDQTFRTTEKGALSYFVGDNDDYPSDKGFALKGWRSFSSYPAAILLLGNVALSIGKVHLTDKYGNVTIVDKTWGFKKTEDGSLCILLHHSSVPYSPSSYAT
jgi:hypothetical protein